MKKLFLIPGFLEKTTDPGYRKIRKIAESKGYEVIPVNLQWNYRKMTDWINTAREKVEKHYDKDSYILGFSFGAFVALKLSREFKFKKSLICSLSTPFFKENLKYIPKSTKDFLGKRRFEDFKQYPFPKEIEKNTVFFQGTKEWGKAQDWLDKSLSKQTGKIRFHKLKDVKHNINTDLYIFMIDKEL